MLSDKITLWRRQVCFIHQLGDESLEFIVRFYASVNVLWKDTLQESWFLSFPDNLTLKLCSLCWLWCLRTADI